MTNGTVTDSALPGVRAAQAALGSPQLLFFGVLAIGVLAIALGRAWAFLHVPLALVLPVVCIVGYAAINVKTNHINSSQAQTADNCYFLGFLYFLASLSATLIFLESDRVSVGDVVRGFGTALITTIVGLATRIVLLQSGGSLSENREVAEADLTQAIQHFRDQIIASTDLLNDAQSASAQSLHTMVSSTARAVEDTVNASKTTLSEGVAHIRQQLMGINVPADVVMAQIRPGLEELRDEVTALTKAIKTQAKATAGATAAFSGTTTLLMESTKSLDDAVANTTNLLARQTDELDRLQGSRELLERIGVSLSNLEKHSNDLEAGFARLLELSRTDNLAKVIDTVAEAVTTLTGHVQELGTSTADIHGTTVTLSSLTEQLSAADGHIRAISASAMDLHNTLGRQLLELREMGKQAPVALERLGGTLVEAIGRHSPTAKLSEMNETTNALQNTTQELVRVIEAIAARSLESQVALKSQVAEISGTSQRALEMMGKVATAIEQALSHRQSFFPRIFGR